MESEPVQSGYMPSDWQAELVNYDGDGEVYVTIFSGPNAEVRAKEYCSKTIMATPALSSDAQLFFINSSIEDLARIQMISPLNDPGILSGGIPEGEDVGELVREIYDARG